MKLSYKNSVMKREVQDYIYKRVRNSHIIGLGGPNAKDYSRILHEKGFEKIILYENDWKVFEKQILDPPDCKLVYDDVLNHLGHNAFYDLDFCCSILSIEHALPDIVELPEYSLTVSIRPVGIEKTLDIFKQYEKDFTYVIYKDTSPMIVIYKL